MMDITGWRKERPTTAQDLREPREPVRLPTLPVTARGRSAKAAEAAEHVETLEQTVEEQRAEIASLQARLSIVDESNAILHEQIASMETRHAAALANMQAKLDRGNEAVTMVKTLVASSSQLLVRCQHILWPDATEDTTVEAEKIGAKFGAGNVDQQHHPV